MTLLEDKRRRPLSPERRARLSEAIRLNNIKRGHALPPMSTEQRLAYRKLRAVAGREEALKVVLGG